LFKQSDYENYDYRQFWQDNKRLYEDSAERIVIKKFIGPLEKQGRVFIDLGCGFGRLFSEYKDFEKIILVDYSVNNLKNAKGAIAKYMNYDKALLKKVAFVAADAASLPFKSSFADVAMTVRVIHHLDNVEKFINEVSRILKPGGYFLLEFANKRNLKNILKFMFGKLKQSPFDSRPLQIGATILDYHPKFIKSLLKQTGFKILRQVSASNYRLGFLKRHINLKVLLFFENIYQNIFSFIDTGPSIFLKTVNVGPLQAGLAQTNPAGIDSTGAASVDVVPTEADLTGAEPVKAGLAVYNLAAAPASQETIESFEDFKTIFCCPSCRDENLKIDSGGKVLCTSCNCEFYIDDGIYIFK
jgi:Methylase involved in ubiquinone/menaquinone biosynthesis